MSDCIWALVARCECENCNECELKISMDSNQGRHISEQYWNDVEIAVAPVIDKWKAVLKSRMSELGIEA